MEKMREYIIATLVTLGAAILYEKYVRYEKNIDKINNQSLITNFLLNDDSLDGIRKPILWIHVEHEKNARWWQSFYSRNTEYLNQPYIFLTIRSIIQHCNKSFQICLIDDDSFNQLLPGWNKSISSLANPVKSHVRSLALSKVLHTYGGLLVPNSFICMKDLLPLYNSGIKDTGMFVCENQPSSNLSQQTYFFPNIGFFGCVKDSANMKEFSDRISVIVSNDFTNDMDFTDECNRLCYELIINSKVSIISGSKIGIKKDDGAPIKIEELMEDTYIDIPDNIYGVYIPSDAILKRRKFEWFARLSAQQALSSNTMIGKYLLISHNDVIKC